MPVYIPLFVLVLQKTITQHITKETVNVITLQWPSHVSIGICYDPNILTIWAP